MHSMLRTKMVTRQAFSLFAPAACAAVFAIACSSAHGDSAASTSQDVTSIASGSYALANTNSGQCVANLSSNPGDVTVQLPCDGGSQQEWHLLPINGGAYTITHPSSGLCLAIREGSADNGAQALQWTCLGSPEQAWLPLRQANGAYALANINSGKCLSVSGASTASGTGLVQLDCNGGIEQEWKLEKDAVETWRPALFQDTSTSFDDGADWDYGHGKATCGDGATIAGLSEVPHAQARSALCAAFGPEGAFSGIVTTTLTAETRGDQRRAQRLGDWAYGYYKWECGDGEYVRAVSEDASFMKGDNRFHAIQCAKGRGLTDTCNTRVFDGTDDRGSTAPNDWDYGAYKGQCGPYEYVAGVSLSVQTGAPHSILCCATTR